MTAVVIGIDPHKRSNTALVLDAHENVLAKQRFANDRDGYRQLNYALHIAALVQVRLPGAGRDYYLRKRDAGKTSLEAMRCLKRRLSDVVFRALLDDLKASERSEQPQGEEPTPEPYQGKLTTCEEASQTVR